VSILSSLPGPNFFGVTANEGTARSCVDVDRAELQEDLIVKKAGYLQTVADCLNGCSGKQSVSI
jgi:hypothetical protein